METTSLCSFLEVKGLKSDRSVFKCLVDHVILYLCICLLCIRLFLYHVLEFEGENDEVHIFEQHFWFKIKTNQKPLRIFFILSL